MSQRWYAVAVERGREGEVRRALEERSRETGDARPMRVFVPRERRDAPEEAAGRCFYPGYVFLRIGLDEDARRFVEGTDHVTGFVGGRRAATVPDREIEAIEASVARGDTAPRPRLDLGPEG